MTGMRRVTIALPEEIDKQILELKKDDRYIRCSYSEMVRIVLELGLQRERGKAALSEESFTES